MEVTDELIEKLCSLSKLRYDAARKAAIRTDLGRMLSFVATVQAVDTHGVEPLIHLTPSTNTLRQDVPEDGVPQALALRTAPKHDSDYIRVPKVLDK